MLLILVRYRPRLSFRRPYSNSGTVVLVYIPCEIIDINKNFNITHTSIIELIWHENDLKNCKNVNGSLNFWSLSLLGNESPTF